MTTPRFEPTPAWLHALAEADCSCHLLLVVEDGRNIVGWCRVFPSESPIGGEIALGLLAAYRGLGWGTKLLEQALVWSCAQGLRQLWLSTWPGNLLAAHLFLKFGFHPTGAWRGRERVLERPL